MARTDLSSMVDELQARARRSLDEARVYLASPEGQELRRRVAQVLVVAAPLLFRVGPFRRTRMGHVLGIMGGAALVVKFAEMFRDWEPEPGRGVQDPGLPARR